MTNYIIQIVIFQLLFLVVYELFYKKNTFFSLNRAYLLTTSIISLLLPFIKIKVVDTIIPFEYVENLPPIFIGNISGQDGLGNDIVETASSFTINWWLLVYLLGLGVCVGLLIKRIYQLRRLRGYGTRTQTKSHTMISIPNSCEAFSFWTTIYLGDRLSESEKQQILHHEVVHIRQKHSLDLIWFEILKVVFWWNPLVYLYQSKITTVHEFIADSIAIGSLGKQQYYEQLLNTTFQTQEITFTNYFFSQSLIKKRILMLQKSKTKTVSKFNYLLILPLLGLMISLSSFSSKIFNANLLDSNKEEVINTIFNTESSSKENTSTQYTEAETPEKNVVLQEKEKNTKSADSTEKVIPFAKIEKVPTTQKCKDLADNKAIKNCVSEEIKKFVNTNFDVDEMSKLPLEGVVRIYVKFKIDKNGKVTDVKSRAVLPKLEKEAIRVVSALPDFIPGESGGEKVDVLYALPIVFKVAGKSTDTPKKTKKIGANEDEILFDTVSNIEGNTVEKGYYLVTGIFKKEEYLNQAVTRYKKDGLTPKVFTNPKDGYFHLYLDRYETSDNAKKMLLSDFDGKYKGDMYILKIQ